MEMNLNFNQVLELSKIFGQSSEAKYPIVDLRKHPEFRDPEDGEITETTSILLQGRRVRIESLLLAQAHYHRDRI